MFDRKVHIAEVAYLDSDGEIVDNDSDIVPGNAVIMKVVFESYPADCEVDGFPHLAIKPALSIGLRDESSVFDIGLEHEGVPLTGMEVTKCLRRLLRRRY